VTLDFRVLFGADTVDRVVMMYNIGGRNTLL